MKKAIGLVLLLLLATAVSATDADLLALINNLRASLNVSPLAIHPSLEVAADNHSIDMIARDFFSHTNPDGVTASDRIWGAGFPGNTVGENLAANSGPENDQQAFDLWVNSPGHYANMVNPNFQYIGIGIASGNFGPSPFNGAYSTVYTNTFGGGVTQQCTDGQIRSCGTDIGECVAGTETCSGGQWGICTGSIGPSAEICDGLDNDCDGINDDGFNNDNCQNVCEGNSFVWSNNGNSLNCCGDDAGEDSPYEQNEGTCDSRDNDCDGSIDEGLMIDCLDYGSCQSQQMCAPCPGAPQETCNNADDNCDGNIDEGLPLNNCVDYTTCGQIQTCFNCQNAPQETCNNIDDNCDGQTDENVVQQCGITDVGACEYGVRTCNAGSFGDCFGNIDPVQEICGNGIDEDCNGADLACPFALALTVYKPSEGYLSGNGNVPINLSANVPSRIQYKVDSGSYYSFCTLCSGVAGTMSLSDGNHNLSFRATSGNQTAANERAVFVDRYRPSISSIKPASGYARGIVNFSVSYTEIGVQNVSLLLWSPLNSRVETWYGCPSSSSRRTCAGLVDVSEFDGQQLRYNFTVYDRIGKATSATNRLNVDITPPVILRKNVSVIGSYAYFNISVSELVRLTYQDNGRSASTLCSPCNYYARSRWFSAGNHKVNITASDNAGNLDRELVEFSI
ncbi:MAG TPA: CAP domain-containing protein [Candidatus Nanoarchaeia archaeon]|nr:CAP domain-containing protein [Candidatus Nanoarchaeia archaeon]